LAGDYSAGWREYEWRWKTNDFPSHHPSFVQPVWDGSELAGRTILVHAEQGFGDAVQFVHYLLLVVRRGGKVILEAPRELYRLLLTNARGWQVITSGEPLPAFDVHCPLLSLPPLFGTTLQNIPEVPYLHADHAAQVKWRERLASEPQSLKVGLAWAGRQAF
jgi:hypothetical protein